MKNLLKETLEILKLNKKKPSDVLWVGNEKFYTTWENFKEIADVKYDAGFGSQQVASDLSIVGSDFWLERFEYDGSEHWEFKSIPQKPDKQATIKALTIDQARAAGFEVSCGWEPLDKINGGKL